MLLTPKDSYMPEYEYRLTLTTSNAVAAEQLAGFIRRIEGITFLQRKDPKTTLNNQTLKSDQSPPLLIGYVINSWRRYHGLSLKEIADKTKIHSASLSKLEHGKQASLKDKHKLNALAECLGITYDDLFFGRLPNYPPHEI